MTTTSLRGRSQEVNAEYWAVRETQSERVAVAQLCLALARAEHTPEALEAERRLTARHHRSLRVTRRTCSDCWNSDHALGALEDKP